MMQQRELNRVACAGAFSWLTGRVPLSRTLCLATVWSRLWAAPCEYTMGIAHNLRATS